MNRLPEELAAPIEEHLLVCERCRQRVAEFDEYIEPLRAELRDQQPDETEPGQA